MQASEKLVGAHDRLATVAGAAGVTTPFVRDIALRSSSKGKRAFDVACSGLLLVVLMPLMLLVALAVKLTSPGPVLFRQRRVGRRGDEFLIRKFRSMYVDAEERLRHDVGLLEIYVEQDHKVPERLDPRITRIGHWLRKTSLDELPQLLNVLAGDMSMVGPRPVRSTEVACYGDLAAMYLALRPGLTGLWQVSGRSDVKFPRRAELDADYARRCSAWVDLRILLLTPSAVVRGRGAR